MRIYWIALTVTLSLLSTLARAQENLSGSPQHSQYVYIYRISDREALKLYRTEMEGPIEPFLHTLTDSVPIHETQEKQLPPGNYLFIRAEKNKLHAELHTEGELRYDLLNDGQGLGLSLRSRNGKLIADAKVHLGTRSVPFDAIAQLYRIPHRHKGGNLQVEYKGVLSYFSVEGRQEGYRYRRGFRASLSNAWPIRYIVRPIRRWAQLRRSLRDPYQYERRFSSFLVCSKPKYKPGDTVRAKAFILDRKGHPVDKPLLLRITDAARDIDTTPGILHPYRPGGFDCAIPLSDSLGLKLDRQYTISLEDPEKKWRLAKASFTYEEYELSSIRLLAHTDKEDNSPGRPVALYLRGMDENDLTLPDARVRLYVLVSGPVTRWKIDRGFIPDTLWVKEQPLDPVGETKILLPDSIFPPASFAYTIDCEMLNSSNEFRTASLSQFYNPDTTRITFFVKNDSLYIDHRVLGHSTPVRGLIYAFDTEKDTLNVYPLALPGAVRIDPYSENYEVLTLPDSAWDEFSPAKDKDEKGVENAGDVFCAAARTRDSVYVTIRSPRHIPCWYTIFCGNRPVKRGYADSLFYQAPASAGKPYFINLKYIWGGKLVNQEFRAPYREKLLHLDIQKPAFMYPGQEARITIGVKDAEGRPVPDADVTAYAFTQKFTDIQRPRMPYLGKGYSYRKGREEFRPGGDPETTFSAILNWQQWHGIMGLDTSEYYRFLHPSPVYLNTEPSPDGLTQVAPFVYTKGETRPADLLYIDELPVFFNQANLLPRYSFPARPGIHSLRIRVAGRQVRIDSVRLQKGMKTFINIHADEPTAHVQVQMMPDSLTRAEQELWTSYMIRLEDDLKDDFITLTQNGRIFLPSHNNGAGSRYYGRAEHSWLAGPFLQQPLTFHNGGSFDQDIQSEGGYLFRVEKGLIHEKQLDEKLFFEHRLDKKEPRIDLHDQVLTQKEIDSLWEDYQDRRSANQDLFYKDPAPDGYKGRLEIVLQTGRSTLREPILIRKIFLFRCDDPGIMRIYKGSDRQLGSLEPGYYRLLFLLKGDDYEVADSLFIRPGGLNYYSLEKLPLHGKDDFSIRISNTVKKLEQPHMVVTGGRELEEVLKTVNDRYADVVFSRQVSGTITDLSNQPLVGATVTIKGLRTGVVTDMWGKFVLAVPERGTLMVNYIGYTSLELSITPGKEYNIRLRPVINALEEVVVVGYGTTTKRSLTGSVSIVGDYLLEGKDAGIMIRGDTTQKAAIRLSSGEWASASISLRRNFRDDAFWQPRLRTDQHGEASFSARLPDDITNWKVYALAVSDNKQTGFAEDSILAFKALSANLSVPNFVLEGDSLEVIGKIMNYLPDSVTVQRRFRVNDHPVADEPVSLRNAHIDHFLLRAGPVSQISTTLAITDSMSLEYSLQKTDGYSDGERRSIPIFPVGVKETIGGFFPLDNADTSLTLSFLPDKGPVTVYAESSLLPVLLQEIDHLRHYEYLCNEQLASKLHALLDKQKIDSLLGNLFTEAKDIREIIARLLKTRRPDGLWGWWNDDEPRLWISLHVTEALLAAEKAGYTRLPDKQRLIDYLVYILEGNQPSDRITGIRLLQAMNAQVDYPRFIDTTEKQMLRGSTPPSLYEKLELLTLRQGAGMDVDLNPILAGQRSTAFGNRYWGEENQQLFDNAFLNTVLIYQLLKKAGGYDDLLRKIRGYFLEKRKDGHWRNTYESSLALQAILPDVLKEDPVHHPPTLTLGGNTPITSFPYKGYWPATTSLNVHKTGSLPVYFTAFQQYWNKKPEAVNGVFEVRTTMPPLHAGVPVVLQVDVRVKADADFVMIEIPIPAGCSYEGKMQSYGSEVHREYFKNKVSIFCSTLKTGSYTWSVRLMPRFTGVYHLNPARAELMYFPLLYGREGSKEVTIQGEDLKNP